MYEQFYIYCYHEGIIIHLLKQNLQITQTAKTG